MPMTAPPGRNAFGDPVTGEVVLWRRNHEEEQAGARIRSITNVQPTIARWRTVRAIRTQGAHDELVYKLTGKCPTLAQHELFLRFIQISLEHSIYFFHCAGEKFECQLSDYEPQRSYSPGPQPEDYLFTYTLQLDVIAVA